MKTIIITLVVSLVMSCKSMTSIDITPNDIVGKWSPTYEVQYRNSDDSWADWKKIDKTKDTLVHFPTYEFKADSSFLWDGKNYGFCCTAGRYYGVLGNKVTFTEILTCPSAYCQNCSVWIILDLTTENLTLEECRVRYKFTKQK